MATFTLTGTLMHDDGVTPVANSGINVKAAPYPDPTLKVLYTRGVNFATDANGAFSKSLITATGLYYTIRSTARTPLFQPIVFAAPTAGTTVDLSSLTTYDPTGYIPNVYLDTVAAKNAAIAAAAGVQTNNWAATTAYVVGQVVRAPDGSTIVSNSSRTSRASFDATEQGFWTVVAAKAGTLEQAALSTTYFAVNERELNLLHGPQAVDRTGVTDSATAFQAALNAADAVQRTTQESVYSATTPFAVSQTVRVPDGEYKVNTELVIPRGVQLLMDPGAKIKAGAAMTNVVSTDKTKLHQHKVLIEGGTIDAAGLATNGLYVGYFAHIDIKGLRIHQAITDALILGDPTATGSSYEGYVDGLDVWRPRTATIGHYGVWMRNCTDSRLSRASLAGVSTGTRNDGGDNRFNDVHPWSYGDSTPMQVAFDDNGTGQAAYINCYSDGADVYAWQIRNGYVQIIGGGAATVNVGTGANTDNQPVAVHSDQTPAAFFVAGLRINGADATHRFKQDFECPNGQDNAEWIGVYSSNVAAFLDGGIRSHLRGLKLKQTTASSTPLVIHRTSSGATQSLQQWADDAGNTLAQIDSAGEDVSVGRVAPVKTTSTTYTIIKTDDTVLATTAAITINLPTAASSFVAGTINANPQGRRYTVRNTSAGNITVATLGGNVDSGSTVTLATNTAKTFVSDGTNWWSI